MVFAIQTWQYVDRRHSAAGPAFHVQKWWKYRKKTLALVYQRHSIDELAEKSGLYWSSLQRIIAEDSQVRRIAAKFISRLLTRDQKAARVTACRDLSLWFKKMLDTAFSPTQPTRSRTLWFSFVSPNENGDESEMILSHCEGEKKIKSGAVRLRKRRVPKEFCTVEKTF